MAINKNQQLAHLPMMPQRLVIRVTFYEIRDVTILINQRLTAEIREFTVEQDLSTSVFFVLLQTNA